MIEIPIFFNNHDIEYCWLYRYLDWTDKQLTHSVGDNPAKNTLAYHIVQHQKLHWLCSAAAELEQADVFVWVDGGIHSVPGITNEIIAETINGASKETIITIPGCLGRDEAKLIPDSQVNWRFCGGLMVVPRKFLPDFATAFYAEAMCHIRNTNNVSWEVNTLQRLELNSAIPLPIWWYQADHNSTLFTNYPRVLGGVS